mmetsp:Transcript_27940/g.64481  ORF Transcript_27940/g.64481 Transcript_27940/m.64481 type:complete len:277 (-) Transcript_27940:289-1119(-)
MSSSPSVPQSILEFSPASPADSALSGACQLSPAVSMHSASSSTELSSSATLMRKKAAALPLPFWRACMTLDKCPGLSISMQSVNTPRLSSGTFKLDKSFCTIIPRFAVVLYLSKRALASATFGGAFARGVFTAGWGLSRGLRTDGVSGATGRGVADGCKRGRGNGGRAMVNPILVGKALCGGAFQGESSAGHGVLPGVRRPPGGLLTGNAVGVALALAKRLLGGGPFGGCGVLPLGLTLICCLGVGTDGFSSAALSCCSYFFLNASNNFSSPPAYF